MVVDEPWNMKYEEPLFYISTNASLLLSSLSLSLSLSLTHTHTYIYIYTHQPHPPADSSATYQKCEMSMMH